MSSLQDLFLDIRSGSSEILKGAVEAIRNSMIAGTDPEEILVELDALCGAHPSMAVLRKLNQQLRQDRITVERLDLWLSAYQNHEASACQQFATHLEQYNTVLVHSNSGLLRLSFQEMRRRIHVFCTESRPAFEGRTLAEELARLGHRVTLISDFAAFSVVERVDVLAFGCDALTKRGIVNKIGTSPLAFIGKSGGKDSYFVATSEKWVDEWDDALLFRQGALNQIYAGPESIRVENFYFDLTPPELVAGLFLENGAAKEMYQ